MKISVITATRNSGKTLRHTMQSVISQDYDDYEHIIIDGGSEDDTLDIIREFKERYNDNIRFLSEPDAGLYDALNKGISLASGEIIGFLNSDDFFSSTDVLSTIAREINGVDAVYADIHYVHEDDLSKSVRYYSSKSFRRWKMIMGFMPAHPSFYCRKEAYDKSGLYDIDIKVAGDFELLLRLIYINRISTKYIPKDVVTMRTGGLSSSGLKSHKKIFKDHMLAYQKNNIPSNYLFEALRYAYRLSEIMRQRISNSFIRQQLNIRHSK